MAGISNIYTDLSICGVTSATEGPYGSETMLRMAEMACRRAYRGCQSLGGMPEYGV